MNIGPNCEPNLYSQCDEASFNPFLQLADLGAIGAILLQQPDNYAIATGVASNLARSFFNYGERVMSHVDRLAPLSTRYIDIAKDNFYLAGRVAMHGAIICCELAEKVMPVTDATVGANIALSMKRINAHNPFLARFADVLGEVIAKASAGKILLTIQEWKENEIVDDPISALQSSFLTWHSDLIGQTVKANVMHVVANLTEQSFNKGYQFKDGERNPVGRLISLIGRTFQGYETPLKNTDALVGNEKEEAYQQVFRELSAKLLAICFPKGASDLQLYHPVLPGMHLAKEYIWGMIESKLPALLKELYLETKPLGEEWKEKFNRYTYHGYEAETLMDIPSSLVESKIRKTKAGLFNSLFPQIEMALNSEGYSAHDAGLLSRKMTRYLKELSLTKEPSLIKVGAFIDGYFTERLLANFTHFNPVEDNSETNYFLIETLEMLFGYLIECDLLELVFDRLKGNETDDREWMRIIANLLIFFDPEKNDFPLPQSLRDLLWPSIQEALITKGGGALKEIIPRWDALINRDFNKRRLSRIIGDSSLTDSLTRLASTWGGNLFEKLNSSDNRFILQFLDVLKNSSENNKNRISFLIRSLLEGLLFQVSIDLYNGYDSSLEESYGLSSFFGDDNAGEGAQPEAPYRPSFTTWLIQNIGDACSLVSPDKFTPRESTELNEAIRLRHLCLQATNDFEKKDAELAFSRAWGKIKPKFDAVLFRLLETFKYQGAHDLPLPPPLQFLAWDLIIDTVPRLLFDEMGEVIQVSAQKEILKREVGALIGGEFVVEGCRLFAQDITNHLPEWMEDHINQLPETLSFKMPELVRSNTLDSNLKEVFRSLLRGEESSATIIEGVKGYLEALFLRVVLNVSKMELNEWRDLQDIVVEAREERDEDDDDIAAILEKMGDRLLKWAGVEASHHLFGLPDSLQKLLYTEVKKKLARGVFELDAVTQRLQSAALEENSMEYYLPKSGVDRSLVSITRYIIDRATDHLSERVDGEMRGVSKLYTLLNPLLTEKGEEGYASAVFLKQKITEGAPTPLLETLLTFLDGTETSHYRETMVEWISPFLKGFASLHLSQLLQQEKAGRADFDQSILMALLPTLTRHLECINEAARLGGGLSKENYAEAAGEDFHPDVHQFYKDQASILFKLIFPHGAADLKGVIPTLEIAGETFDLIQERVESEVAAQLPTVIETLFDRETLVFIFSSVMESIVETFEGPIEITAPREKTLTPGEEANQKRMDAEVGRLILEAIKFTNLPPLIFKGMSIESIGAGIRKKFDGRLFHDILPLAFQKMEAKKHVKKSAEERRQEALQDEKNLKSMQGKLASSGIAYLFNYLGAQIDHATDVFDNPTLKFCRDAIMTASRFILVNVIGGLLRIFRVDQLAVYLLSSYLDRTVEKSLDVFAQPKLQENFVCRSVEALEEVLNKT